jgi:O-antigen/teichoic acid export membrane protein
VNRSLSRIQSLKAGAAAQMLPIVAGYGTNLLATPYVLGRLGLHDFGVWSITGAIAQYAVLLDLGVSRAANRYVALFHAKGDTKGEGAVVGICVTGLAILGALLTGLTLLTANVVDRIIGTGDPELASYLLLCAVSIMITGLLARVFAAASVCRGRQVPAVVGVAILSTLQVLGGVTALVVRPSLSAFATGTVVGTILGLGIVMMIILFDERRITIGRPHAALAREILTYGIKSQVIVVGDLFRLQSGKLIAGIMIGPAAAGVFELATRLAMGAQAFGAASAAALTPYLTRSYIADGMASILAQYERLTQRNSAVAIFVPFALMATATSAIPLWLGHNNDQVLWVLLALLSGIAINVSTAVCTSTLSALGRPGVVAQVTVVAGVLLVASAVALGARFELVGIAIAFAIGEPALEVIGLWYMHRRLGIPLKLYFRGSYGPYAVCIIAVFITVPIGMLTHPYSRESAVWPFITSVVLFGAMYALLGWSRHYLPRISLRRRNSHTSIRREDDN